MIRSEQIYTPNGPSTLSSSKHDCTENSELKTRFNFSNCSTTTTTTATTTTTTIIHSSNKSTLERRFDADFYESVMLWSPCEALIHVRLEEKNTQHAAEKEHLLSGSSPVAEAHNSSRR
ncbi:unnamed protein product [Caenorhabditis sp. 36 PRJEB53466]|nr:unnamed protein product [Caenorhabditis sp. 36 PRJEB53466]